MLRSAYLLILLSPCSIVQLSELPLEESPSTCPIAPAKRLQPYLVVWFRSRVVVVVRKGVPVLDRRLWSGMPGIVDRVRG